MVEVELEGAEVGVSLRVIRAGGGFGTGEECGSRWRMPMLKRERSRALSVVGPTRLLVPLLRRPATENTLSQLVDDAGTHSVVKAASFRTFNITMFHEGMTLLYDVLSRAEGG